MAPLFFDRVRNYRKSSHRNSIPFSRFNSLPKLSVPATPPPPLPCTRVRSCFSPRPRRSADIADLELYPVRKAHEYVKAADAAVKLGHLESAELHLRNAMGHYIKSSNLSEIIPEIAECSLLLGIVLERRGHLVQAELFLRDAAKRMEKEAAFVPLIILRKILINTGRFDEADELPLPENI